jgi:predicted RND superfamily exporter protein
MLQIQKISKLVVAGLVSGLFCLNYVCPQVLMPAGEVAEKASSDNVKQKSRRKARFKKIIKKIAFASGITAATAGILAVAYVTYIQAKTKEKISFAKFFRLLGPYTSILQSF